MAERTEPEGDWSDYPVRRVEASILNDYLHRILMRAGCNDENASASAKGFMEADMRGVGRQGLDHIANLLRALERGDVNGSGRAQVVTTGPAFAVVDGALGPGHGGAFLAAETVIDRARESGCATVALTNSADIYMIGIYAGRIAEAGLVGLVFTVAPSRVHPEGGVESLLGTNPLAIGIPTATDAPIVHDMSTSAVSHSTVRQSAYLGLPLPPGSGVNSKGQPTTDAESILAGAISPLAGHKGFGLGLCVALLWRPVDRLGGGPRAGRMARGRCAGRPPRPPVSRRRPGRVR